ncbi:MAG: hypothetical protein SF051_03130 [Elusimicrobiota bacterium]|nr:hypothetical protein [Elusimicrobiota bacterium]
MAEPWFKARADGIGWTPADARGWTAWVVSGLLLAANFARLALTASSVEEAYAVFLPEALGLLLALFWLCLATGQELPALKGKVWFKAKRFGWGWTPAAPEGWVVVGLFLASLLGSTLALVRFRPVPPSPGMVAEHLVLACVLAASLVGICWKTGEKPGWRWG